MFNLDGKVALITGAASGLGLSFAKELLKNGLKGVTLVDSNETNGQTALVDLQKLYGDDKVIFVRTDVTNKEEFDDAFKKTIEKFQHVDILINNAGIYNDFHWEKEIDVNIKGVINGMILGLENYLKEYKQGNEAVILNTSSVAAFRPGPWVPIYGSTKAAIASLTQTWGHEFHYNRNKVRVVAVCPGGTQTSLFCENKYTLIPEYVTSREQSEERFYKRQSPEFVAGEVVKILKHAHNGSFWIVESAEPAYEYILPDRNTFKGKNVIKE